MRCREMDRSVWKCWYELQAEVCLAPAVSVPRCVDSRGIVRVRTERTLRDVQLAAWEEVPHFICSSWWWNWTVGHQVVAAFGRHTVLLVVDDRLHPLPAALLGAVRLHKIWTCDSHEGLLHPVYRVVLLVQCEVSRERTLLRGVEQDQGLSGCRNIISGVLFSLRYLRLVLYFYIARLPWELYNSPRNIYIYCNILFEVYFLEFWSRNLKVDG